MTITAKKLVVGVGVYAAGTYAAYVYLKELQQPTPASEDLGSHNCCCAFDRLAPVYDDRIGMEESMMGCGLLRRWMLRHAKGDVLEISAGTGRNLPYYRYGDITSLTLADISKPMLERAESKYFDDLQINFRHPTHKIRFCVADAEQLLPQPQDSTAISDAKPTSASAEQQAPQRRWWHLSTSQKSSTSSDPHPPPSHSHPFTISSTDANTSASQSSSPPASPTESPEAVTPDASASFPQQPQPQPQPSLEPSPFSRLFKSSTAQPPAPAPAPTSKQPTNSTAAPTPSVSPPTPSPTNTNHHHQPASSPSSSPQALTTFQAASFDTVVDTFGLCSCEDPVKALQQAAAVVKPGGSIILLEHGSSSYGWLQRKLEEGAEQHYRKWGCRWNRDILGIVEEAGLDVQSVSRWHFGTTYMIVARAAQDVGASV